MVAIHVLLRAELSVWRAPHILRALKAQILLQDVLEYPVLYKGGDK